MWCLTSSLKFDFQKPIPYLIGSITRSYSPFKCMERLWVNRIAWGRGSLFPLIKRLLGYGNMVYALWYHCLGVSIERKNSTFNSTFCFSQVCLFYGHVNFLWMSKHNYVVYVKFLTSGKTNPHNYSIFLAQ